MLRRIVVLCLGSVALVASAGSVVGESEIRLSGGQTELRFNLHLLGDLGLTLSGSTARISEPGVLRALAPVADSAGLFLQPRADVFDPPRAGYLAHVADLRLEWKGGAVSLDRFELHSGLPPEAFELRAADGSLVFVLDNPHPQPAKGGEALRIANMDLRLSTQFAARLGAPELAGLAVGEAHLQIEVAGGDGASATSPQGSGGACTSDFTGSVDVALSRIGHVSEAFHDATRVALAPDVTLQNVGTADVPWFRPIAPDGTPPLDVVGQHPFLVMHLYRMAGGRIEQIGRSDVKHAFFSANSVCVCQSDQVLYNQCTDRYGSGTNASRTHLAPREEVTASTGDWTPLGSHFDGATADAFREHSEADHADPFEHRLSAAVADLTTPDAEYWIEAWYLVKEDVDIFNSMGRRAILPTPPGPSPSAVWTFPFEDVSLTLGSAVDSWVDPAAPPAGASNVTISTSPDEGELKLAAVATPRPSGLTHYEYALMNFDFDRRIDSFTVPLPAGAAIWNAWFGDGDSAAGADWTPTVSAADITWTAPAGDELDWGTMFNFAFDTNASPADLAVTLGVLEAGSPLTLAPTVMAPSTLVPVSEIEVALAGAGAGAVVSTPAGIDCAGDCDEIFANGLDLEFAATPAAGSAFVRWEEAAATVTLASTLGFSVAGDRDLRALFETCQVDVVLGPQTVSSPTVFHACESLSAGGGFEVLSEVIFRAGQWIGLRDGFTVGPGGGFTAEIAPEQSSTP